MRFIPLCSLFCLPSVFTHCPSVKSRRGNVTRAKALWPSSSLQVLLMAQNMCFRLSFIINMKQMVTLVFAGKWPREGEHTPADVSVAV